jgi:sodium/hydrogen exchanger-like protein 6/7
VTCGAGLVVALLCALLTKHVPLREHHIVESTLFLVLSYSSYLIAEVARCSGIIAILTTGIVQACTPSLMH